MVSPSPRSLSFGSVAERYERFRPGYPPEAVDLLLASSPTTAVEVGAGTGKATREVAGRRVPVTAVEPDPEMAVVLRRTTADLPVIVVELTLEELPRQEPVDLLYSAAAWHWTDPDTRWSHAAELLVPGGTFACLGGPTSIADPALDAEVMRLRHDVVGGEHTSGARNSEDGTLWPGNELRASPLFERVRVHDLTTSYAVAADDLVGQMSTVSAFIVLPDDVRADLLARIRAMLPDPVQVRRDLTVHLARRV